MKPIPGMEMIETIPASSPSLPRVALVRFFRMRDVAVKQNEIRPRPRRKRDSKNKADDGKLDSPE